MNNFKIKRCNNFFCKWCVQEFVTIKPINMKKLTNFWIISLVLTVLVGFSSCSKDDDDTATDPTSNLTSKVWVIGEGGISPESGDAGSQITALLVAAFSEPSQIEFKADKVCNYSSALSNTGTWSLSSDFKTLTIKNDKGTEYTTFEIVESSSTILKLKKTYKKADLETTSDVTLLFTYKPKA